MEKDFDKWNEDKKVLDNMDKKYLFRTADIWWCSIGLNIAEESCGKGETFRRPVLILKKLSNKSFIGIPLSSQKKEGSWFCDISILNEIQYVLLYQIKMLSVNRLQRRLTTLDDKDFSRVKEKLQSLLELSNNHQDLSPESVGNPKSNLIIDESENKVKQENERNIIKQQE
jgi:mRNA interferase MazF